MERKSAARYLIRVYNTTKNDSYRDALAEAIAALRPVHIDREAWTAEWEEDGECNHKPYRVRDVEKWKKYKCSKCGYKAGRRANQKYCPSCGRAMTDEAVQMVMERLEALKDGL